MSYGIIYLSMKTFKVKFLTGDMYTVDDTGCDNIEDFKKKVYDVKNELWKENFVSIRLIYAGKIIETDKDFHSIGTGEVMVAMGVKKKKPKKVSATPTVAPTVTPTVPTITATSAEQNTQNTHNTQNAPQETTTEDALNQINMDATYGFRNSYAATFVFMTLIKQNPELRELFETDFNTFAQRYQQGHYMKIYNDILQQSNNIMNSMNAGGTIQIVIGDNGTETSTLNLTEGDIQNVDNMVNMGFDRTKVIQEYLKNNKDIQATLNCLLN